MKAKKALNPSAVQPEQPWLIICCNAEGNRVVESHHRESSAMQGALVLDGHDHRYGHKNQYIVRHRSEVTIID